MELQNGIDYNLIEDPNERILIKFGQKEHLELLRGGKLFLFPLSKYKNDENLADGIRDINHQDYCKPVYHGIEINPDGEVFLEIGNIRNFSRLIKKECFFNNEIIYHCKAQRKED